MSNGMYDIDTVFISPQRFVSDPRERPKTRRKEKKRNRHREPYYPEMDPMFMETPEDNSSKTGYLVMGAVAILVFSIMHPVLGDILRFYFGSKVIVSFRNISKNNVTEYEEMLKAENIKEMKDRPTPSKQVYIRHDSKTYCAKDTTTYSNLHVKPKNAIKKIEFPQNILKNVFDKKYYLQALPEESMKYYWVEIGDLKLSPHVFKENKLKCIYFHHLIFFAIAMDIDVESIKNAKHNPDVVIKADYDQSAGGQKLDVKVMDIVKIFQQVIQKHHTSSINLVCVHIDSAKYSTTT